MKTINGHNGYFINEDGNVFSIRDKRTKFSPTELKPFLVAGYKAVKLYSDEKTNKTMLVHRLIAYHFIPNPENKKFIDHIDRNPLNNSISNLRWATHAENMQNRDYTKHIYQFDKKVNFIREFVSVNDASKKLKINRRNMLSCVEGKRKSAGGFIFKYEK